VNTGKVARRKLQFQSIAEVQAEIGRIVAADADGRLRTTGNWTPGQICDHLAAWIEYGYSGYPMKPPPWIIRVLLRWQLRKMLRDGMPGGVKIPGVPDGTYGQDNQPLPAAAERLMRALDRLQREPCPHDSPAFGRMSHEDRIALNLRHAELHLGFLAYG
jgi:hypothetical protein